MIYTGLGRLGEISDVKAHGGADVAEVYGGINEANPIYYKTRTITGQTPLSYKALSKPLSDYLISGNAMQDGTPTPSDPVDVIGCGEKTENIYDKTNVITIADLGTRYGVYVQHGVYSIYNDTANSVFYFINDGNGRFEACPPKSSITITIQSSTPSKKSGFFMPYNDESLGDVSIVAGSTPPSYYIPYGYKLTPTVNGTEYTIYLWHVPTVRKIRKVVFDGTEQGWGKNTGLTNSNAFSISMSNWVGNRKIGYCTHYQNVTDAQAAEGIFFGNSLNILTALTDGLDDTTKFKQWLTDQYAAGTPVTIWYILADPETGIVNEPLMKIGKYADTISMAQAGVTIPTVAGTNTLTVDTTVQPSEVSITGNIKEVQGT